MSIRDEKRFYDRENKRFVKIFYPIVAILGMTIVFFIAGLFTSMGTFILFSFFAFTLAAVSLVHDHWMLNSLAIPFGILFISVSISDFIIGNYGPAIFHGITGVFSMIVLFTRNATSFIVMSMASFIYAIWIFTIFEWTDNPYYGSLFGSLMNGGTTFVIVLFTGLGLTVIRTFRSMYAAKRGEKLDCDGGYCPM